MDEENIDVEEVAEEAKKEFNLIDRIKNRNMRTTKVHLGFDEVAGEQLQAAEAGVEAMREVVELMESNSTGIDELKKDRTKLKKQIKEADQETVTELELQLEALEEDIADRTKLAKDAAEMRKSMAEMEKAADEIRQAVRADSLSIELRALPPSIAKGAARRARKALGITEKGIPEDKEEDFADRNYLEVCHDQMVRFRDNKTGFEGTKLSIEELRAIHEELPLGQSQKLFQAVTDLQVRNAISDDAVAQTDF